MSLKQWALALVLVVSTTAQAQKEKQKVDTTFTDYDLLFDELDLFLDSLMAPRSFAVFNAGLTSNYFSYQKADRSVVNTKKFVLSPSLSYFHKTGLGVSLSSSLIREEKKLNPYQFVATASYDWIGSRKLLTGVSFSRFFTKDSLAFYTSPLQNQLYGYFTYRKFRLRPTVAASYGWGSRTAYEERKERIKAIRLRPRGYTQVSSTESVYDFSLTTSLRYDFYWLDVLGQKDFFRISPQLSFVSGTQKFGFNQSSNTYGTVRGTGNNILFNSENISLDDATVFQPISLTAFVKTEYSVGKFFLQPQLMFDYYFPATDNRFSTVFLINAGVLF